MICWSQLGIHRKPVGLVNTLGFYDRLLAQMDHSIAEGFLNARCVALGETPEIDFLALSPNLN